MTETQFKYLLGNHGNNIQGMQSTPALTVSPLSHPAFSSCMKTFFGGKIIFEELLYDVSVKNVTQSAEFQS